MRVKVFIDLGLDLWHGHTSESIWAERISEELCIVDNIPFYAFGISYLDKIRVSLSGENLVFIDVVEPSGHSTYRIIPQEKDDTLFRNNLKYFESIGCNYEVASESYVVIDVPPEVDIYKVYSALERGQKNMIWDFEEGNCSHPIKN